jgi:hypothetical protein
MDYDAHNQWRDTKHTKAVIAKVKRTIKFHWMWLIPIAAAVAMMIWDIAR